MTLVDFVFLTFEVAMVATVLNLPFGYLRAPTKKFSIAWFAYIHVPIPAIFILRKLADLDGKAIPFIIAGAVLGQVIGARLNRKAKLNRVLRIEE